MTVLSDYVARMVEGGMDQDEAMQIAAELFAAGVASAAVRPSSGALRTRKWRENNRHKPSQCDAQSDATESVTDRHKASQSVTGDNASLSIDKNKKEKKERTRASQMPDGWKPSPEHWERAIGNLGSVTRAEKELQKFSNNAAAKGLAFKKWDAAWDNWVHRAVEWSPAKPAAPLMLVSEKISMEEAIEQFKKFGRWSRFSPVNDISQVPVELLAKHGLLPDGRKINSA